MIRFIEKIKINSNTIKIFCERERKLLINIKNTIYNFYTLLVNNEIIKLFITVYS